MRGVFRKPFGFKSVEKDRNNEIISNWKYLETEMSRGEQMTTDLYD